MKAVVTILSIVIINVGFAQDTLKVKLKYNLAMSQVGLNFNENAMFIALGGPGISYSNTKTEFALRFLASIRFDAKKDLLKPNESIRPLMGFGLQVKHKKAIVTPAAFYFYNSKWEYAAGIGYLIGGKEKNK